MIKVRREVDGKIFTSDVSTEEGIYEMHFSTSFTQVRVQEFDCNGKIVHKDIFCQPDGSEPDGWDFRGVKHNQVGSFIEQESK